jgi:hypothetical protein
VVDFQIFWPSGFIEHVKDVAANQLITVEEGKGIVAKQQFYGSQSAGEGSRK